MESIADKIYCKYCHEPGNRGDGYCSELCKEWDSERLKPDPNDPQED